MEITLRGWLLRWPRLYLFSRTGHVPKVVRCAVWLMQRRGLFVRSPGYICDKRIARYYRSGMCVYANQLRKALEKKAQQERDSLTRFERWVVTQACEWLRDVPTDHGRPQLLIEEGSYNL